MAECGLPAPTVTTTGGDDDGTLTVAADDDDDGDSDDDTAFRFRLATMDCSFFDAIFWIVSGKKLEKNGELNQ